jgi:COP9 signalosome complex subunit 1
MYGNVEPMQLDLPAEESAEYLDGIGLSYPTQADPISMSLQGDLQPFYQVENSSIDIDAYAALYNGLAKIHRLMYIADHCPLLAMDALRIALNFVKNNSYNTPMYSKIQARISEMCKQAGQPIEPLDQQWVEHKAKRAAVILEKLDTELKNYKSNSIKESIRRGHDGLGDHYLDMGDLNNALKCYVRSRDYCINSKQVLNMCLNAIKVSVYLRNWPFVITYVSKAEHNPEYQNNRSVITKLSCAAGLANLAASKYELAAKNFLTAHFDDFNHESSDLLCANNVATYGGLCALATYERTKLHKQVLTSSSFKLFLESEPQLRDAITCFYESKYANCLSILKDMRDNLLLDLYLAPHVNTLYAKIRNRALVQYFSPYISAEMPKMAAAFNTTVRSLEDEIMQLILEGQIQV